MIRTRLLIMLAAVCAVAVSASAASAGTVTVGYIQPGIAYGSGDGAQTQTDIAFGQVHAQGVVVDNLEPGRQDDRTTQTCPASGCTYVLAVLDSTTLQASPTTTAGALGCDSLDYGVVDSEPAVRSVGGGRVYDGQGRLPARTNPPTEDGLSRPLAAGVGNLCFVARSVRQPPTNDGSDGPLAATQPRPVVIFHNTPAAPDQ